MGLKDILPVEKVYDDLLSPSVKQVGLALENVFKTARFSTFAFDIGAAFYDNRWQKFLKRISDKVEPQNIVEGQPQIVIPVLNALDLQQEDSLLSELFINLLSATIDKTKQDLAHPAFPNILNQLSHDEAIILFYLKKKHLFFNIGGNVNIESDFNDNEYFEEDFIKDKILYPQHLLSYLKHLSSLEITNNSYIDDGMYFGGLKSNLYFPRNSFMQISAFGKIFADACIPDEFEGL